MAGSKVQSTITIIYTYDQLNLLDDFSSPNKFTLLFFFFCNIFLIVGHMHTFQYSSSQERHGLVGKKSVNLN